MAKGKIAMAHPDQWFGDKTYSQHGEDLMLLNLIYLLGLQPHQVTYLDIGAHHPFHISNTALLYDRGAKGVNIEANPNLHAIIHQHRTRDISICAGVGAKDGLLPFYMIDQHSGRNTFSKETAEQFVKENPEHTIREVKIIPVITPDQAVDMWLAGQYPTLLSIDAEGLDLEILQAIDYNKASSLKLLICEAVSKEAALAIRTFLESKGFFQYCRCVSNLIFVRQEDKEKVYG